MVRCYRGRGAEPAVLEEFYRLVIQAVLFFVVETWLLLAPMPQRLDGFHVGFTRQVTMFNAKAEERFVAEGGGRKITSGSGGETAPDLLGQEACNSGVMGGLTDCL